MVALGRTITGRRGLGQVGGGPGAGLPPAGLPEAPLGEEEEEEEAPLGSPRERVVGPTQPLLLLLNQCTHLCPR